MCFTKYLVGIILSAVIMLIAGILFLSPLGWPIAIGAITAGVGIPLGIMLRKSILEEREYLRSIAEEERQALGREMALDRRKEAYLILQLARLTEASEIVSAADAFVEQHLSFASVRDKLPSMPVSAIDHTRRTLIEIMRTSLAVPGSISSKTQLDITSSIEAGTALIETTLTRYRESVEGDVLSSTTALSTQLGRMVQTQTT